jgi:dUTP pyrophosphatase
MIFSKIFSGFIQGRAAGRVKVYLESNAFMPVRAHAYDAGLDLRARERQIVEAKDSATFDTGVHIQIPKGYVGFLKSKSGLNVKHNIISDGVIDCGYEGSIVVKLYNLGGYPYTVEKGDKISQLVILPCFLLPLVQVKKENFFKGTERGSGGFGSTGR